MILNLLLFVVGVLLLVSGAEGLVRGGARLATALKVSPLVIGLTIVAFGTSMPEMVVSVIAALDKQTEIAVGNVVGSNIFNILGILGPAALIAPLVVHANVIRREVPVMIGVSFVFVLFSLDNRIHRAEGSVLFAGIVAYTVFSYWASRRETAAVKVEFQAGLPEPHPPSRLWVDGLYVVGGLVLLVVGARVLVNAAVPIARSMGVTERVIGLTLVAMGTSMPEFATSVVAAFRRQTDIAVGNLVGSNIFNILSILGVAAMVEPLTVSPAMLHFDIPIMTFVAISTLPIIMSRKRISRTEGALYLTGQVVYTTILLM
jgi:cation:H+ antiporter